MFGYLDKYIAVFLSGILVTYILTPIVRAVAIRCGVVDRPDARRPHKRITPRAGGVAVVIGVHVACAVGLFFPWPKFSGDLDLHWWQGFLPASMVLLVVGLIDDVRGMKPLVKLGGQGAAAAIMFLNGARFGEIFGHPLPVYLDFMMVELWLLGTINAFNLIDGLDGLASGLAIISAIGLGGIFAINHSPGNVLVLLGLVGACLGFLRYNFHPATIFLGDTGSMFLGFILGAVALQTYNKNTFALSLGIPMMVLGVPIYDALLAIWRRTMRGILATDASGGAKKGPGIMQPDLDHLHHRLAKTGLSTPRVASTLFFTNAMLVFFGLLLTTFHARTTGIFLITVLVVAYVLLRRMAVIELRETGRVLMTGLKRPSQSTMRALLVPVWDVICLSAARALAMRYCDPPTANFWHTWFVDLPIWVTPTISLLAISRAYVIVWQRARLFDILTLELTLLGGLVISVGITLMIDPTRTSTAFIRAVIIGAFANVGILAVRMTYRCVEEMVDYLRAKPDIGKETDRILLYGAGGRCQLFLRERGFNNSSSFDGRQVVGLIDDEPSLHFQWVYGVMVLGGIDELPTLVERHKINGIVVTTALRKEAMAKLRGLAAERGLSLTEWRFQNHLLLESHPPEKPAATSSSLPGSPATETQVPFSGTVQHPI